MSISSDASKPSFANSSTRLIAALRHAADLPAVKAIREALPYSFVGLIGAMIVLLPITRTLAGSLLPALSVMGAALVVVLSVRMARDCGYNIALFTIAAAAAFVLSLPRPFVGPPVAYMTAAGASALFLAMVVCLCAAAACALVRRAIANGAVADVVAAAIVIAVFAAMAAADISPSAGIASALHPLGALGDSYAGLMVVVFVETALWAVGIHGPAMLAAVVTPLYLTLQTQNSYAYAHHQPMPHIVVTSLFLFVFPGGAGATLSLAALLAVSHVKKLRNVGRISLVPAIFNANEPLMYGAPVVFNPLLAAPFVLVPLVLATLTYGVVALGWVARPIFYVPSFVPSVASTYLATLDWRAVLLVLANVAISGAIYLPFVRAYERQCA
jgi:lactose/cellobiose-specific phosphotransferase system IIC component